MMESGGDRSDPREDLGLLFGGGSVAGLTDGQLLEGFATRGGLAAERMFEALVERHGGLVLQTCRAVLRDEHAARDAFQATFLALARRGGSLWVRDSVGPYLHRVAHRAAVRLRRGVVRRRAVERQAALEGDRVAYPDPDPDRAAVVHQEVDRLPERYRVAVVLCDLEGRSLDDAARALGCPVGTVKSRLSRARERLRGPLTRRGLAPETARLAPNRLILPAGLARSTVAAVVAWMPGAAAPSFAAVVWRSVPFLHPRMILMPTIAATIGLALCGAGLALFQQPSPAPAPAAAPSPPPSEVQAVAPATAAPEPVYAWKRTDRYDPPDFARFFPDDVAGGLALDRLWADESHATRPAAEILPIVRRGLRRTTSQSDKILRDIGHRFVWNGSPQDPDAIEILYHALDYRGPFNNDSDAPSIYYGFLRINPKPPAVLHAMVDWCLHKDNTWDWVAWCGRGQRDELLSFLQPALESPDEAMRERAAMLVKYLGEAPDATEAYNAWATKILRANSAHLLPGVKQALMTGNSHERFTALQTVMDLGLILDESFNAAFRACVADADPGVRRELAQAVGHLRHIEDGPCFATYVAIALQLTEDANPQVRYDAVYYGLTPLPQAEAERDRAVRRLVLMALTDRQSDLPGRIAWGLQQEPDAAQRLLDEQLHSRDPERVAATRLAYKEITGRTPPGGDQPAADAVRAGYIKAFRDLYDHLGRVYPSFALKGIDWPRVGAELLPRAEQVATEEQFGLLVEELVARLEDSHDSVHEGSATPPTPPLPTWNVGIACLTDDRGRVVVYAVHEKTPAYRAGVRLGMAVVAVDGVPIDQVLDRWMEQRRRYVGYSSERYLRYDAVREFDRQLEKGTKVALELEAPDGGRQTVELAASFKGWYIPRLPVPQAGIDDGQGDVQWVRRADGIGYILVRRIRGNLEVLLDQAVTALGAAPGLIIDVRGNSGGGFEPGTAFRNFDLAAAAPHEPRRPVYRGPIAVLIDERCISAGEGWASWFVATKRARFFGSTTAGASARRESYTLTNGLYKVEVSVKAYTGSLDRPIERRGLEPDVPVRCTARDIANGRDTVAEAAAAWLKEGARP